MVLDSFWLKRSAKDVDELSLLFENLSETKQEHILHFGLENEKLLDLIRNHYQREKYYEVFYDTADRKLTKNGSYWLKKKVFNNNNGSSEIWSLKEGERSFDKDNLSFLSYQKHEGKKEEVIKVLKNKMHINENELEKIACFEVMRVVIGDITIDCCQLDKGFFYSTCRVVYTPDKKSYLKKLFGNALLLPVSSKILTYLYFMKKEIYRDLPSQLQIITDKEEEENLENLLCCHSLFDTFLNTFDSKELHHWFTNAYDGSFKSLANLSKNHNGSDLVQIPFETFKKFPYEEELLISVYFLMHFNDDLFDDDNDTVDGLKKLDPITLTTNKLLKVLGDSNQEEKKEYVKIYRDRRNGHRRYADWLCKFYNEKQEKMNGFN